MAIDEPGRSRRSFGRRVLDRFSYYRRLTGLAWRVRGENSPGTLLRYLISAFRFQRRDFDITVGGQDLKIRSHSGDLQVAIGWFKEPLAAAFDVVDEIDGPILDAGGYIGISALSLSRRFPGRKIIAVEPSQDSFRLLKYNTRDMPDITVVNAAIGPRPSEVLFDVSGGTPAAFHVDPTASPDAPTTEKVTVVSVSQLMKKHSLSGFALAKIDIEGYEIELFETCNEWIDTVGLIAIELHEWIRTGSTRAYIEATAGRRDLGFEGELYFSVRDAG